MKRRLREIPTDLEGCAVVLDCDGFYELVPGGTPVASADGIHSAAAVIFVDVRRRYLDIDFKLPCKGHIEERNVTVRYQSRVVSPVVVLDDRVERFEETLRYWTGAKLSVESARLEAWEHDQFETVARQAIAGGLLEQPPVSPAGIELSLVEVNSELAEAMRDDYRRLFERIRDTETRLQGAAFEEERETRVPLADDKRNESKSRQQKDAARLAEAYRRGAEAVLALMATADPAALERLAARSIQDRGFLVRLLLQAAESGVLNGPVVEDLLTDAANELLKGSGAEANRQSTRRKPNRGMTRDSVAVSEEHDAERAINLWLDEQSDDDAELLRVGGRYTAHFNVGEAVDASLIVGAVGVVPDGDVLPEGALWQVLLSSPNVAFEAVDDHVVVRHASDDDGERWTARFELFVPPVGDSEVRDLIVRPTAGRLAELQIDVIADGEPYRRITVSLRVVEAGGRVVSISDDTALTPLAQSGMRPGQEWQTPPSRITITIVPPQVIVFGDIDRASVNVASTWSASAATFAGLIDNLRSDLDVFRVAQQAHLDDLTAEDVAERLAGYPERLMSTPPSPASAHDDVRRSDELRRLASTGHQLFNAVFPHGSEVRDLIENLAPGSRVDFNCSADPDRLSHVPWDLMYVGPQPQWGEPVDPEGFLGLRLRVGNFAYPIKAVSKALGSIEESTYAHVLYWGDAQGDATAAEALRHRAELANFGPQLLMLPTVADDRVTEVLAYLAQPTPSPVGMLYLFCQVKTGDGSRPVLRFGSTSRADSTFDTTDLVDSPLADQPLVFLNGCGTGAAQPLLANQLRESFLRRQCRAVVATEAKVPIVFATHFATVFFQFFYRRVHPDPIAAGEAFFQTRRFFWTEYANLGGLLYSYVNQYEVFTASAEELASRCS